MFKIARELLFLAFPICIGLLGASVMGLTDLYFLGQIGPTEVAAGGVVTAIFSVPFVVAMGLVQGLEYMVAFQAGAGNKERSAILIWQGFIVSLISCLVLTFALFVYADHLSWTVPNEAQRKLTREFLKVFALSLTPLILFTLIRSYLQALGSAWPGTLGLLAATLANVGLNKILIHGLDFAGLTVPGMGAIGSAYATLVCRLLMCLGIFLWAFAKHQDLRQAFFHRITWRFDSIPEILRLGVPSALHLSLEVGVFSFISVLAARLSVQSSATHQLLLGIASTTFMIPLGISSATAVLVGHNLGAQKTKLSLVAGRCGLIFSTLFMTSTAILFLLFPQRVMMFYSKDAAVIELGTQVFFSVALFQIFDGLQVTAAGGLRGLGNTKAAMWANLISHWALGLPIGLILTFHFNQGLVGLWRGLGFGLFFAAIFLTWYWEKSIHRLLNESVSPRRPDGD